MELDTAPSRRISVSARKLAATLWELQEIPLSAAAAAAHHHVQKTHESQPQLPRNADQSSNQQPSSPTSSRRLFRRPSIQHKARTGARTQPISANSQLLRLRQGRSGARPSQESLQDDPREIVADNKAIAPAKSFLDVKTASTDFAHEPTTSSELLKVLDRIWTLEEQHSSNMSMAASLRVDLERARARVQELTDAQKSHRKDAEDLAKKLADEKALWQEQEQEAIRAAVQSIQQELEEERKSRRKLDLLHRKTAKELADVKKSLGEALQDLEREKKARELMEDVCDELAREIGEDKAQVEELKRESAKVREEVEEERKMLQMAEVWREERVQMKLGEARLELEEKNTALNKVRSELEVLFKAKREEDEGIQTKVTKDSDFLRSAVDLNHVNEAKSRANWESFYEVNAHHRAPDDASKLQILAHTKQELDEEDSVDDDLCSIELNKELFLGDTEATQSSYSHVLQQQGVQDNSRRSVDRGSSPAKGVKMGKASRPRLENWTRQVHTTQDLEEGSVDDDLCSIELNKDSLGDTIQSGYSHVIHNQQGAQESSRRSVDRGNSPVKGAKMRQGLERTIIGQSEAKTDRGKTRENGEKWDEEQDDSQWIDISIERGELRGWNGENGSSLHRTFWGDRETQGHRIMDSRSLKGCSNSFSRNGDSQFEGSFLPNEAAGAAWRIESSGSSKGASGLSPLMQSVIFSSSPTRSSGHYHRPFTKSSSHMQQASNAVKLSRAQLGESKSQGLQDWSRNGEGL